MGGHILLRFVTLEEESPITVIPGRFSLVFGGDTIGSAFGNQRTNDRICREILDDADGLRGYMESDDTESAQTPKQVSILAVPAGFFHR